ncbi:DUF348 domain-containing protein [Heliobacterium undosum]|uniref:DUF348 domain-containing protein n=1 Tax=Heliomicrobium undosum TaxID=121734 RepID=A0A845L2M9_9FIRM|nr:3D domain-containing protein [Heliomicrobium undosum]MZP29265.1 DUF348 domain-containing protein [Heliomicrobium undosum]
MTIAAITTKEKGWGSLVARPAIVVGIALALAAVLFLAPFFDGVLGKAITVEVDGQTRTVHTSSRTVGEMLKGLGIACEPGDQVYPDVNELLQPGMSVQFRKSRWVELLVDNRIITFRQVGGVSTERIADLGVPTGQEDRLDRLDGADGDSARRWHLVRLTRSSRERSEPVTFSRQVIYDSTLPEGVERVAMAGADGVAVVREQVTFEDGREVSAEALERQVIQSPRPEVVIRGGAGTPGRLLIASRGGSAASGEQKGAGQAAASAIGAASGERSITRTMRMEATAYTHTGNRTATGVWPHVGIIAVDPGVIPLGTMLYVEGYGMARAADTGGAIRGSIIDVFFDSNEECFQWGRRKVTVHILE